MTLWFSGSTIHTNIFIILQNLFIMLCWFSDSDQLSCSNTTPAPVAPPFNPVAQPLGSLETPEDGLSVFDVLNMFRHQWFLHWDHLIANILSTQKDNSRWFTWVNFQAPFHTHLVQ